MSYSKGSFSGGRSYGSSTTAIRVGQQSTSPTASSPSQNIPSGSRRRGSLSNTVDAIRHAGGPNSIDNFARSWTRAAGFFEVTPSQTFFVPNEVVGSHHDSEAGYNRYASPFDDADSIDHHYDSGVDDIDESENIDESSHMVRNSPGLGAGGINYGSLGSIRSIRESIGGTVVSRLGDVSRLNDGSMRHAASMFQQQQGLTEEMKEREPLLVRRVEREDGKVVAVIVGQSTMPQTVFNSVNVLIGIGLLSLPLGLKYSGWLIGVIFLTWSAWITNYTAKLLAKCMDKAKDQTLVTYADISYAAFGHRARIWISVLFSMELLTACVASIILFADSLNNLVPSVSVTEWKLAAIVILSPLSFLPLRVLSFSSVLGIMACLGIVSIIFIDGLSKPDRPGSLIKPMPTHMWPQSWAALPMSFGLLMSPWGGHSVFPNIYKDMRHPHKYRSAVDITYGFTFCLDMSLALIGVLMFGDLVKDEITSNVLSMASSYPAALSIMMVACIAIVPLTKTPLNARPIITTIEVMTGLDSRALPNGEPLVGMFASLRGVLKIFLRILCNVMFVCIAILFPAFENVMGLLGSFLTFSICVILPIVFYLKICAEDIKPGEKTFCWILLGASTLVAALGTVWSFLPPGTLPDW